MKLTLIALVAVGLACCVEAITEKQVVLLKNKLWCLYKKKPYMTGSCLRLSFHDCVGSRCDGCINFDNSFNNGLKNCVNPIEKIYKKANKKKQIISRADFWTLAGQAAAEFGMETMPGHKDSPRWGVKGSQISKCGIDSSKLKSPFTFRVGRIDCPTSPIGTEQNTFPRSVLNFTGIVDFFSSNFNMTAVDAAAIMGGHTLGRSSLKNSGHDGKWIPETLPRPGYDLNQAARGWGHYFPGLRPNPRLGSTTFDNEFYKRIVDPTIVWDHVDLGSGPFGDARPQFNCVSNKNKFCGLMLHSDFGVYYHLNTSTDGTHTPGCNVHGMVNLCKKVPVAVDVESYAMSNGNWFSAFTAAWDKMVSHGYTSNQLTAV